MNDLLKCKVCGRDPVMCTQRNYYADGRDSYSFHCVHGNAGDHPECHTDAFDLPITAAADWIRINSQIKEPEKESPKYLLVTSTEATEFTERVEKAMRLGFKCQGGVSIGVLGVLLQAMTKDE